MPSHTMTPEQRKANRLYLATETMQETKQYLEAYAELLEKDATAYTTHCSAILQLAIVCYCKTFMGSKTRNKADPSIEADEVDLFKTRQDLKVLHDLLFEKRNKLIAHTEWEFHTTELVATYVHPEIGAASVVRQSRKFNPCAGINEELFYELAALLEEEFDEKRHRLDTDGTNNGPVKPRA